CQQHVESPLTF
nr:immunoglobulin light chain junction region [Macaca mulatta]